MSGAATVASIRRGTVLWIEDKDHAEQMYMKVEVKEDLMDDKNGVVKLTIPGTQTVIERSVKDDLRSMYLSNAEYWNSTGGLVGVQDLASLMHLHEPAVLESLQLRFDVDQIYSFCGGILIAVNPFKDIKNLYSDLTRDRVIEAEAKGESEPHIFTIASRTLNNINRMHESQVVLISGESGAGKTKTTKYVLNFLSAKMGQHTATQVRQPASGEPSIEDRILESNPLLEAFGNACTVRNHNSSRFGKFIEMRFSPQGTGCSFIGACIDTYLLEKVRVTNVTENKASVKGPKSRQTSTKPPKQERSYHIFYQVCAYAKARGQNAFGLPLQDFEDAVQYSYLNRSPLITLEGVSDVNDFELTIKAMQNLGLGQEEQCQIIRILAAVLNLGNVQIEGDGEAARVKQANKYFEIVSQTLQIKREVLTRALTCRVITTPHEKYETPLKPKEAEENREALARAIYGALFLYIVKKVNESLAGSGMIDTGIYIGVLDIFGFESFEQNSFEQLCINFANEKLQQLFNEFVFQQEQRLYESEGVPCDRQDFPDNADIINLIEGKAPRTSIFSSLDEECRVPGGHDQGFCDKVRREFSQTNKNVRFEANPRYQSTFTINHFAGPVTYECARFLDKNNDEVGELLKDALSKSSDRFVTDVILEWMGGAKQGAGKMKKMTVSSYFKKQLDELMTKLGKAQPHFVRCLKPNPDNVPEAFVKRTVAEQLRSGGVIEALRVQRSGFPCRVLLESSDYPPPEIWKDYLRILLPKAARARFEKIEKLRDRAQKALEYLTSEIGLKADAQGGTFAVGRTKVFFKQATFESVNSAVIAKQNQAATFIQKECKMSKFYLLFRQIRRQCCFIQAVFRGHLLRRQMWDSATPEQRLTNPLFNRYKSADEQAAAKKELEALKQAEQRQLEAEQEQRRQIQAEADARKAAEEKKAKEEQERRLAEMRKKAEDERKKVEEARKKAEEQRRRLDEAEKKVSDLTVTNRKLQGEIEAANHQTEMVKFEHDQKLALAQGQERLLQARVDELERENARLRGEVNEYINKMTAMQQARDRELASIISSQDEVRLSSGNQVDRMKKELEEKHDRDVQALKERETLLQERFREQANALREHQLKQSQKHSEELQRLKTEQHERQAKFEVDIISAQQEADSSKADRQIVEQQLQNMKRDNENLVNMMQTQSEEMKRMYTDEIKLMQARFSERENALMEELDLMTKQHSEQMGGFNGQLEKQEQAIRMSCQQEVEFVKKQAEQREKSLMQMLERAREGETEKSQSYEVQLKLKDKQAAETRRCLEAKCQHLEDANKRAQELYEQHVEQLTRQLKDKGEQYQTQLQMNEEAAAQQLAEVTGEFRALEARVKVEREQQQATLKAVQGAAPENRKLKDELAKTHKEIAELKRQLIDARARLKAKTDAERQRQMEAEAAAGAMPSPTEKRPSVVRRMSSLRTSMMPQKMAPPAWAPAAEARKVSRTKTWDTSQMIGAMLGDMLDTQTQKRPSVKPIATGGPTRDVGYELLRPSEMKDGQECIGKVAAWKEMVVDSAVTIICLGNIPFQKTYLVMAVATQTGVVYIFHVAAQYSDPSDGASEPLQKLRFRAHNKAITYMSFGVHQDELVTSSSDERVRVWNTKDATILIEIKERSLVPCALPIKNIERGMLIASEGARDTPPLLRLCSGQDRLQTVRLEHSVRSLVASVNGERVLAGSSKGLVLIYDVTEEGIEQRNKLQATHAAISCLTIGEPGDGSPPLVIANSAEDILCIMQANKEITNLTVYKRIPNPHKMLPIRNCYIPVTAAAGFIVSGAEEPALNILDMESFGDVQWKAHKVPVVDAAVSNDNTLMATGDVRGTIILWRRSPGY